MQKSFKFRILSVLFCCIVILSFVFANPVKAATVFPLSKGGERGLFSGARAEFVENSNYVLRVFHDGYWWLQYYDDSDKLINEVIDPDQS